VALRDAIVINCLSYHLIQTEAKIVNPAYAP